MIRILIIGIAPFEINVMENELQTAAYHHVATIIDPIEDWKTAVNQFNPDVILAGYDAAKNLALGKALLSGSRLPPVICFAGAIGGENAVELIKNGITDVVFESNPSALVSKITAAIQQIKDAQNNLNFAGVDTSYESAYIGIANAIVENCMEGILLTIPDGKILSANPAACEMFGMTEQELIATGRMGLVDKSDPNLQLLLEERRNTGKAKGEVRLVRKDGTIFPAIISSAVFTDISGNARTAMSIWDVSTTRESQLQLVKSENNLIESCRRLNKTLESSQDIICSLDDEARFVTVSAACETIWGYTPEELIGKPCFDFVEPEDRSITSQTNQTIKEGIPVTVFENRYLHKSGRIVHMLWSAKWDKTEKLIYAIAKDITETKRLEKACEVERKRFLDLYELAPCSLGILKGPDHIFEMANPLYLQMINKTPDIIGKSVQQVLPELEGQGIFEILDHVYNTGGSFVANEKLFQIDKFGNGTLADFYLNLMYMAHRNDEGHIDGILFFAIDVTEQVVSRNKIEESAKLYHDLIMELPVAAYSCDSEGKIVLYNKAAVKLWGREPEIGKELWCGSSQILSPDGIPIPLDSCPMAIALKEGRTVSGTEIIMLRQNGERRNILPHAVPYFNANNQIVGAVNMLTDITKTKLAEINLKQQNEELLKANKELDRFVYSVSHDLRSPLTSIMGIAGFIEEESAEPDTITHIRMIRESINRLDGFIRKILIYSQNNRTSLEVEPIAINKKIHRIVDSLKNMSPGKQIDFQIDIDETCPFGSDRQRFNAIVENLISNAIKYNNPATEHKFIKITGRVTDDALHLSVSDNGIGIATQYHEKIFDMFFRISGNSEGSGIGLYIVKDMVERLGGSIKVSSHTNGVTQFDVVLKNLLQCQD